LNLNFQQAVQDFNAATAGDEGEVVKYVATCTVGRQRNSHASFFLNDSKEVGAALTALAEVGSF
jgi:hypothetical protein